MISETVSLSYDVLNDNLGEYLTVTVETTVTFAAFLFEDDHLVALDGSFGNFAYYFCAVNEGSAYFNIAVIVGEKNAVELYGVAGLYIFSKEVNVEKAVFLCLELLALDVYDYVHLIVTFIVNPLRRRMLISLLLTLSSLLRRISPQNYCFYSESANFFVFIFPIFLCDSHNAE